MQESEALLYQISQGNLQAFKQLYRSYWRQVYGVCIRFVETEEDASELTQDIFFSLWRRREQLDPQLVIGAYLHQAAKNQSFRYLRDRYRKEEKQADYLETTHLLLSPPSDEQLLSKELHLVFDQLVANIQEPTQSIYRMSREEELSHRSIATKLNISVKMVNYHIGKALNQLRNSLQEYL